jgi:hypothetical protein
MRKCSGQVHGMLTGWVKKDLIAGLVKPMGHCINNKYFNYGNKS